MLAKLFSLFFLLMPVCLVQAQDSADYTNSFGGVDSYQDSSKIAKTDAQDARNVLTDNGKLTKRPGSVTIATVLNGFPIYTIGEYISPSNVRYLIAQASTTVYASDLGATGFVAIATVTAGYPLDFTPAFGKVYFTNGIDTPFSWDGTTTVWLPTFPKCGHVEFADERIYCSNVPNFRSTTYASRYGDATDWTIPAVYPLPADAPNSFTFNRNDGDQITCMKVTPWGKFIGKKSSSYILKGQDNDHYYKQIVSPTVGCLDDRSVQMVDGELVWLGQDTTIYEWSGNEAPKPASREIDSYVKSIRQATAQQNNYNTSTLYDWRAGTTTSNGTRPGLDIETWPGSVKPSTWSHIDASSGDWNNGALVNLDSTTLSNSLTLIYSTYTNTLKTLTDDATQIRPDWVLSGNTSALSMQILSGGGIRFLRSSGSGIAQLSNSTNTAIVGYYSINLSAFSSDSSVTPRYYFISSTNNSATTTGYYISRHLGIAYLYRVVGGTETLIGSYSNGANAMSYFISVYKDGRIIINDGSANRISISNEIFISSFSAFTIMYCTNGAGSNASCDFGGSGVYTSDINSGYKKSGSISSPIFDSTFSTPIGGTFNFSDSVPVGSTIAYSVRGSNTSGGVTSASWNLVSTTTNGAYRIPLDSKEFWQYKTDFSTQYSTQTPILNSVTLNATSTGTYYSKPQYIGTSITSWDLFSADQQVSDIRLSTFAIRSALTPFGILDVSPAWTTQVNGSVPTISTGSYVQFKFDLNPVTSTNTLQVDGVNVAWREGESRPLASLYDDHRYVLCANTTPGTNINDLCLVWQKNKKWIPFSGQSWGALARFNNYAIAGDGSNASKVWKILDPTYLNDDGIPINAYWVTKDFDYDKPNQIKVPMKLWLEADNLPTSFLTIGFASDKGNTWTSSTIDLAQAAYLNTNVSDIFDGFALGKYFKFKFSDNTLNSTFKLNAYSVYYDSKPLGQE